MKFILFFLLPALAVFFAVYLFFVRRAIKRRDERIRQEADAEERRQAVAMARNKSINSMPIIDWAAHRRAQQDRTAALAARQRQALSRRDDSDDIMNPLHPLNPLNPIGLVNSILSERDNEGTTNIFPGGGSFGGAGSSASWEPSTCNDDSSSRHSSYGSDSGSSYSSSDSSSYSSSDSGSSSSSCD